MSHKISLSYLFFSKIRKDVADIELATPGSEHVSAVRHVTDCVKRPSKETFECNYLEYLPVVQEAMF